MLLGNGIYGSDSEIKKILSNNYSFDIEKDWKVIHLGKKFNSENFVYGNDPLLLSFHHKGFIEFQKNKVKRILNENLFDGIEFAESYFPGWCNLNTIDSKNFNNDNLLISYYGDVNPFVIFNPNKNTINLVNNDFYTYVKNNNKYKYLSNEEVLYLESIKDFITLHKSSHEFLVENIINIFAKISTSKLLYKIWCEFRSSVITIFNEEISNLISSYNENRKKKFLFNIWTIGAIGTTNEDIFNYTGIDIKSIISKVNVDNIIIQTNWSDWDIPYLGTGYILGYDTIFNEIKAYLELNNKATTSIGLQLDFITKYYRYTAKSDEYNKTIPRGISWFNSISKLAEDIGYNYITGYELSIGISKEYTNEIFFSELYGFNFENIHDLTMYNNHCISTSDIYKNFINNNIILYSKPNFNNYVRKLEKSEFSNIQIICYEKNNWLKVHVRHLKKIYYINPTGEFKMLYCKSEDNKTFTFDSRLVNKVGQCNTTGRPLIILDGNFKFMHINKYNVIKDTILYKLSNNTINELLDKKGNPIKIYKGTTVNILTHMNDGWKKIRYLSKTINVTGWINDTNETFSKELFFNKYYYLCSEPKFSTVDYTLPIAKQDLIILEKSRNNWLKIESKAEKKWINILGEILFLENLTPVYELPTTSSTKLGNIKGLITKTGESKNNWIQIEYITFNNRFNEYALDIRPSQLNNPENNTGLNAYRGWINAEE